jgi:hypothetical protein
MLYAISLLFLWIQAFLIEIGGETGLLFRLWLIPVVALAFRSNQVRIVPILFIGLLTDGLLGTPAGVHVLEIGLVYGVLMASAKHLSDQTVLSRTLIACLITVADTIALSLIQLLLPFDIESSYLTSHFFQFLFVQLGLIITIIPLISWLYRDNRRSDVRFRNSGDNA